MKEIAHIAAVAVTGSTALAVTWSDGTASAVDPAGLIARGSERIALLKDLTALARAELGLYGGNIT